MKLISLNIWGGIQHKELFAFLQEHAADTDIFCFQEVFNAKEQHEISQGAHAQIFQELIRLLSDFNHYYLQGSNDSDFKKTVTFELPYGQATFVRKGLTVTDVGGLAVYRELNVFTSADLKNHVAPLQYARVEGIWIFNLHGLWYPGSKLDTPDRIEQSLKTRKLLDSVEGKKILCGDFNLHPQTQSMRILCQEMSDLVSLYKIPTTRSKVEFHDQTYADFTLVSKDIVVKRFEVPDLLVSDHLPMILEFE